VRYLFAGDKGREEGKKKTPETRGCRNAGEGGEQFGVDQGDPRDGQSDGQNVPDGLNKDAKTAESEGLERKRWGNTNLKKVKED